MIKRGFTVLISALLAMFCLPALAAVDMTSSGSLTFSVGLDGNFEFFTTNTPDDYSTGELYIACPCREAHDAGDLSLAYSLVPAADCPYTMVIDNASDPRVVMRADDSGRPVAHFTVGFFIDCVAKEALPLKAGAYPFTVVASASCACGNSGTATAVIEMVVSDGAASRPTHFGSTISDLLSAIRYQPDLVYQYDDMGDGVWFIQAALSDLGVYDGSRTGHYGFLTRDAVAHFQRMQGLPASGKCDAKTMARLFRLYLGEVETTYAPGYLNLGWNEDAQKITALLDGIDAPVQLIDLWTDVPLSVDIDAEEAQKHLDAWPTSDDAGARAPCARFTPCRPSAASTATSSVRRCWSSPAAAKPCRSSARCRSAQAGTALTASASS